MELKYFCPVNAFGCYFWVVRMKKPLILRHIIAKSQHLLCCAVQVTFDKSETPEMKAALSNGFRSIAQYFFDSEVRHVTSWTEQRWGCRCDCRQCCTPMFTLMLCFGDACQRLVRRDAAAFWLRIEISLTFQGKGQKDDPNREKIAMTSPVAAQMSDNSYKVSNVAMPQLAVVAEQQRQHQEWWELSSGGGIAGIGGGHAATAVQLQPSRAGEQLRMLPAGSWSAAYCCRGC